MVIINALVIINAFLKRQGRGIIYAPILLFFIHPFVFAQKKFEIGVHLNPILSFVHPVKFDISPSNYSTRPYVKFSTGVDINYYFKRNLGIKTGLVSVTKSFRMFQWDNSNTSYIIYHPVTFSFEIPIGLIYRKFLEKGFCFKEIAGAGLTWNHVISYSVTGVGTSAYAGPQTFPGVWKGTLSPHVFMGFGLEIPLSDKTDIMELGFSYHYDFFPMDTVSYRTFPRVSPIYDADLIYKQSYAELSIIYYPSSQKITFRHPLKEPLLYVIIIESLITSALFLE